MMSWEKGMVEMRLILGIVRVRCGSFVFFGLEFLRQCRLLGVYRQTVFCWVGFRVLGIVMLVKKKEKRLVDRRSIWEFFNAGSSLSSGLGFLGQWSLVGVYRGTVVVTDVGSRDKPLTLWWYARKGSNVLLHSVSAYARQNKSELLNLYDDRWCQTLFSKVVRISWMGFIRDRESRTCMHHRSLGWTLAIAHRGGKNLINVTKALSETLRCRYWGSYLNGD